MILCARAKINLGLDVTGTRKDGYHLVRMVMQTVDLYDRIEMLRVPNQTGVTLKTNLPYIPTDASNLAVQAAELIMHRFSLKGGLSIRLLKRIPVAAGLAGGSADAAAVLTGMNRMFSLRLSKKELMRQGLVLGADVPYCVMRGTALAEGIGEKLTVLPAMPHCYIVIAKPDFGVSTKKIYSLLDSGKIAHHPDIDGIICALKDKDLLQTAALSENVLEPVTASLYPEVITLQKMMKEGGALTALMSGSGPSVFGIFETSGKALEMKDEIIKRTSLRQVFVTSPYNAEGDSEYG